MNRWQFEELIAAINSTDWWTLGITSFITIVNAVIMVRLGLVQNKLQKRQTEAQEYDIYKSLYLLLTQVHYEMKEFLNTISFGTFGPYYKADKDSLKRKEKYIDQLKNELKSNYIDYELKFSNELFNKQSYYQMLDEMTTILYFVNQAIDRNEVTMPMGSELFPDIDGDMEKSRAFVVANRFENADAMFRILTNFIELKRKLGNCEDVLKTIKERCKIN